MKTNLGREVARRVGGACGLTTKGSRRTARLFVVFVLSMLVGAGCSGKSTAPAEVKKLPAMSLRVDPIADSSATYSWLSGDSSTGEYNIAFPDSAIAKLGRVDDILLTYTCPEYCWPMDAFVFSPAESKWVNVEAEQGGGICLMWPRDSWRLLSAFETHPHESFLSESHTLRLHGVLWRPKAKLLRYRDDYAFVVTSPDVDPQFEGLAFDGKLLWATSGYYEDSLLAFDLEGRRIHAMRITAGHIGGMTWDGAQMWVVLTGNPPKVARLSETGSLTVAFTIPFDYWDDVRGGIVWMDGLLWVPHIISMSYYNPVMQLVGMDPTASIASGVGVIVEQLSAPSEFRSLAGMTAHDSVFVFTSGWGGGSRVLQMSRSGVADEGQPLRINAGPITWDGESLWMLHSGPVSCWTHGSMLSRFTLE